MLACVYCNFTCIDKKYFISHVQYTHGHHSKYACDKSCGRVYQSFDSFRKHVNAKHLKNYKKTEVGLNSPDLNICKSSNNLQSVQEKENLFKENCTQDISQIDHENFVTKGSGNLVNNLDLMQQDVKIASNN